MLAVLAMIVFILAMFGVQLGAVNLLFLGLALTAAHLAFGSWITVPVVRRRPG